MLPTKFLTDGMKLMLLATFENERNCCPAAYVRTCVVSHVYTSNRFGEDNDKMQFQITIVRTLGRTTGEMPVLGSGRHAMTCLHTMEGLVPTAL
jgi:hypothetical protein